MKVPNTYLIIAVIICICAVASWLVPGGEISADDGVSVFHQVDSNPQTWQVFSAFYEGFVRQAPIIILVLIVGGAFWIVNESRAVEVGIRSVLSGTRRLERNRLIRRMGADRILMVVLMVLFSLFGAVFGMSEETIAFVAIIVPLAIRMGYDSITGVCLVYVASNVGFASAFLNPFTVGVAQNMSGIRLFSGIEYRFGCWIVLTVVTVVFVLVYASRVRRRPEASPMHELDSKWTNMSESSERNPESSAGCGTWLSFILCSIVSIAFAVAYHTGCVLSLGEMRCAVPWLLPMTSTLFILSSLLAIRHGRCAYILVLLGFVVVYLIIGVMCFGWYLPEMSALFMALAVMVGMASGMNGDTIVRQFLAGARDIMSAALVIGLAGGIVIVLQDGKIMDTILNSMATHLGGGNGFGALTSMYVVQNMVNVIIPSATAKAAITIPIMAPLADLMSVSRQSMVLAFQFGDGFTNMITPTSGVLIGVLSMARIPYGVWFKWIWKAVLALVLIGMLLLVPTLLIPIPGF